MTPAAALLLLAVGMGLGAVLLLGRFGFTAQYRAALTVRDYSGLRAQVVLVAFSTITVGTGLALLPGTYPLQAPIGPGFVVGALLFGAAMQLANGCASGVLFALGGGSPRMALALAGFVGGAFLGSLHVPAWDRLPQLPAMKLTDWLPPGQALLLQVGVCGVLVLVLARHALPARLLWAAGLLAVLNLAVLAISGSPWSVTWPFALWGARAALALGWDATGSLWAEPAFTEALAAPLWQDPTSVTDIGVILGAFAAARATGQARPSTPRGTRPWIAAALGGVAMGYGARLSHGCNIGAFVSGAACTSVHGWLWAPIAFAGSAIGIRLRPAFGLSRL